MSTVTIDARFNGPDGSANGGYACGAVAAFIEGPARVRLQRPPPLDHAMTIRRGDDAEIALLDGDDLVARAWPWEPAGTVPPPPTLDEALAGRTHYRAYHAHIYPRCFVCGPQRIEGDGLRIFAGPPAPDEDRVASDWRPSTNMLDDDGRLRPVFAWAAMDCPSYFALNVDPGRGFLLGQMSAALEPEIPGDEPLVVYGWRGPSQGRKHHAGAALADARGRVWARAEHVWIALA